MLTALAHGQPAVAGRRRSGTSSPTRRSRSTAIARPRRACGCTCAAARTTRTTLPTLGSYDDELVVEDGRWRFLRRSVTRQIPRDPREAGLRCPAPIHLVYSVPPAGVSDEEYSAFYETHVAEILETPGFVEARRYWLAPAVPNRPPVEYRHAAVYVLDRPSAEPLAELARRRRGRRADDPGLVRRDPLRLVRRPPARGRRARAARPRLHDAQPRSPALHDRRVPRLVLRPCAREPDLGGAARGPALRAHAGRPSTSRRR